MKAEHFVMPDQRIAITPLYYGFEACKGDQLPGYGNRGAYLCHYVFEGCGTIEKNGKTYTAAKDDIFVFTPSDIISRYVPDKEDPWVYAWVAFTADGQLPNFPDTVYHEPAAQNIFSAIREHPEGLPVSHLYNLIYDLLWLLGQNQPVKPSRNYAENARIYLESDLHNSTVAHIANTMHIDRRYLTRLFREAYGVTPQQYLMNLRLTKAKEYLSQGYSVTETAAMSGFSDLSNFSKKYKQYYGITPQQQQKKPE